MKKINTSGLYLLVLFITYSTITFSQTVINYQTWTGASGCNIFGTLKNVPATINGATNTIPHLTAIGQPTYDNTDKSVNLASQIIGGSQYQGTEYRTTVNFKMGYSYKITVNAARIKTQQTDPDAWLRLDLNNGGSRNNTSCSGTGVIDANGGGGFKQSLAVTSTTFNDYVFNYPSLSTVQAFLMVAVIPTAGSGSSSQSVLIRKITIEETPPPFNISATPPYMSCGSSSPVTFTINNPPVTGITGYNWNLGSSNNNWLYNGNPAPPNISSSTNTLILTPVCGKVPNAVGGIVTLNGSNINTTNTASLSYYQPGLTNKW